LVKYGSSCYIARESIDMFDEWEDE
jgi:hypothetical protein